MILSPSKHSSFSTPIICGPNWMVSMSYTEHVCVLKVPYYITQHLAQNKVVPVFGEAQHHQDVWKSGSTALAFLPSSDIFMPWLLYLQGKSSHYSLVGATDNLDTICPC
jgi:hypothetical protein